MSSLLYYVPERKIIGTRTGEIKPSEVPEWVQISRAGVYRFETLFKYDKGENVEYSSLFFKSKEFFRKVVEGFYANVLGSQVLFNYDHGIFKGESAGVVTGLELRDDDKELWASVDWTIKAREKIASKEYHYCSTEFVMEDELETSVSHNELAPRWPYTLVGVGLVNQPRVDMLAPLIPDGDNQSIRSHGEKVFSKKGLQFSEKSKIMVISNINSNSLEGGTMEIGKQLAELLEKIEAIMVEIKDLKDGMGKMEGEMMAMKEKSMGDEKKEESMGKESMGKESMPKESMPKESMPKESMGEKKEESMPEKSGSEYSSRAKELEGKIEELEKENKLQRLISSSKITKAEYDEAKELKGKEFDGYFKALSSRKQAFKTGFEGSTNGQGPEDGSSKKNIDTDKVVSGIVKKTKTLPLNDRLEELKKSARNALKEMGNE